ncbi:predicted protein [Verticillium alfalfae VaMs.102]|uniref:Predicted protein n=1 Tax=Verticillium alfalfae (strain VaMs.102 / ATCC MYA-4576 / FGSC 10136) TaxID=526221 RepID=C9S7T3_VERA1|nr:predicted protein [Verticillium alfalfae VaMs.102]EEY14818.1 predicted protein [Verticillium alfalfae VaMs.102]
MPYNTTAIPPRKEVTGQPALPHPRRCGDSTRPAANRAQEMFIQHLANEAHNQAKLDRKPRRNVQYKDLANAVAHNDNLEFLEDVIPKTTRTRDQGQAQATRAPRWRAPRSRAPPVPVPVPGTNGAADTGALRPGGGANGVKWHASRGGPGAASAASAAAMDDPSAQLQAEMRQAAGADHDGDVDMTG